MARETVKELGIEVSSDKQNASSLISRQGLSKQAVEERRLGQSWEETAPGAQGLPGGSLSRHVYTFCPGPFSRIAQLIPGR